MAISSKTREQINKLKLTSKGSTGISLSKVPTIPGVGNLIVSAGGAGADLLLEAKGLISQCCCDGTAGNLDKRRKPSRVRYLAFDTDGINTPNVKSTVNTGQVGFDKNEQELVILDDSGLKPLLDPKVRKAQKNSHPEIFEWINTNITIPQGGNGAGGVRQAGRAMLFLNINKIVNAIDQALDKLARDQNLTSLNIFYLSGISGGTGSGTFLDLAFLLRQRAEKKFNVDVAATTPFPIQIYGYLLAPDVNMLNAKGKKEVEDNIRLNGGAALQELDHFQKNLTGFRYQCNYGGGIYVDTTTAPFNYVHLICSGGGGGHILTKAYEQCRMTAAEAILNFVADAQAIGTASAQFPLTSYYSNIYNQNNLIVRDYPERDHPYLANGVSSWSVPSDRILKYIFTQMFKSINSLFGNAPKEEDVWNIFDILQCGAESRLSEMMKGWTPPVANTYTYDQVFKGQVNMRYVVDEILYDATKDAREVFGLQAYQFKKSMETYFTNQFVDINKGPVWCNYAMTNSHVDCQALTALLYEESQMAQADYKRYIVEADKTMADINNYMNLPEPGLFGGNKRKQEYVNEVIRLWNQWAELQARIYAMGLLLGGLEDDENSKGFFEEAIEAVVSLNNQMFNTTVDILEALKDVVTANDTEIAVQAKRQQSVFTWNTQSIPRLDQEIDNLIHAAGVTDAQLAGDFLKELLVAAKKWTSDNVDVTLFIEDYLENHAKRALNTTLEGLLLTQFPNADSLVNAVEQNLLPILIRDANPMFLGNTKPGNLYMVNVPMGCDNILKGAQKYAKSAKLKQGAIQINTSALTNRISVVCTSIGIALYDYSIYPDCESVIGRLAYNGLYLNEPTEGRETSQNWKTTSLPSPIPRRYHLTKGIVYPKYLKDIEDKRLERFHEARKSGYPCLEMTRSQTDGDYSCKIYISARLKDTEFEKITDSRALMDIYGKLDVEKLRDTIAKLNDWLTNRLPSPANTHVTSYVVKDNICNSFTQEQNIRIENAALADQEEIREEEAWNTLEWFYLRAYEYYATLESEIRKYDEVKAKKDELDALLKEEEDMPVRCEAVIKMIASGILLYNDDTDPTWGVPNEKGKVENLVAFEFTEEDIAELKAYEALELKRRHENIFQREWYGKLLERVKGEYDKDRDMAIRSKDKASLIRLKDTVEKTKKKAEKRMEIIKTQLRQGAGLSRVYTAENENFYEIFVGAADNLINELQIRIGKIEEDEESTSKSTPTPAPTPAPAPEKTVPPIPETGSVMWTCPTCGKKWKKEFKFCPIDMTPQPPEKPATWICPTCGKEWEKTFKFCPMDMTPQPQEGNVVPAKWTCPGCGNEWEDEFKICPICGKPRP